MFRLHGLCASMLLAAALLAQEPGAPAFDANTKLVRLPFNVEQGGYFVSDLQPADFILREDGHPRDFTVFEGPETANRPPLELILLFDTTVIPHPERVSGNWNPGSDYEFLSNWDEAVTREVLQRNGMDIRLAVYHFAGNQLERLCGATSDPQEIANAFHALLAPIPPGKGELTLLPGYKVSKPMLGPPVLGWLSESVVATLKDAAASAVAARRMLVVFTNGGDGTTSLKSTYSSIVDPSLALNIPINPVVLDFSSSQGLPAVGAVQGTPAAEGVVKGPSDKLGYIRSTAPYRNLNWFTSMGEQTGGSAFIPPHLDRDALSGILGLVRDTLQSQYVVGFVPDAAAKSAPKSKKHSLAVALTSKSKGKIVGGEMNGLTY